MEHLNPLVTRARDGDLDAFGRLVRATQTMAFAVAVSVVRDHGQAQDAVQETRGLPVVAPAHRHHRRDQCAAGAAGDALAPGRRPGRAGVGYGLERLAMLRYGIDDIRKVDVSRVA